MSETKIPIIELSLLELQINHLDRALDDAEEGAIRLAAGSLSFFLASNPQDYSTGIRWLEERIASVSPQGRTLVYLEGVRDALSGARAALEAELRLRKLSILARGPRLLSILAELASSPSDLKALAERLGRQVNLLLTKDLSGLVRHGLIKQSLEGGISSEQDYQLTVTGHTVLERIRKEQTELAEAKVDG